MKLELGLRGTSVFPMKCPGCPSKPYTIAPELAQTFLEDKKWETWQQVQFLESIETVRLYCDKTLAFVLGPY